MRLWKIAIIASMLAGGSSAAQAQTEVKYTYDALGRVISVTYLGGAQDGATIEYTYDAAGNRTQVERESPLEPLPTGTERKMVVVPLLGLLVIPVSGS